MQTEISILSVLVPLVICIYIFKDLFFTNKLQISNTQEQLVDLASEMYSKLKGNNFVLSAGELNYKAYAHFKHYIEDILTNNKDAKFTIYCGPYISIDDKHESKLNDRGYLQDEHKGNWSEIHPILDLLNKYPDQITLKLKKEKGGNHFFYSVDDKVAWSEEEHEPFEETVSYFREGAGKSTFNVLERKARRFDEKSTLVTVDNAANTLLFKTEKMMKMKAA